MKLSFDIRISQNTVDVKVNSLVLKNSLHIDPASGNDRRSECSIFGWRGFLSRLHCVSASDFSRLVGDRSRAED